jgi:hypothetical protein
MATIWSSLRSWLVVAVPSESERLSERLSERGGAGDMDKGARLSARAATASTSESARLDELSGRRPIRELQVLDVAFLDVGGGTCVHLPTLQRAAAAAYETADVAGLVASEWSSPEERGRARRHVFSVCLLYPPFEDLDQGRLGQDPTDLLGADGALWLARAKRARVADGKPSRSVGVRPFSCLSSRRSDFLGRVLPASQHLKCGCRLFIKRGGVTHLMSHRSGGVSSTARAGRSHVAESLQRLYPGEPCPSAATLDACLTLLDLGEVADAVTDNSGPFPFRLLERPRDGPGTGAPGTGAPGTGAPGTGPPGTGAPGTGAPGTGAPGTGAPGRGALKTAAMQWLHEAVALALGRGSLHRLLLQIDAGQVGTLAHTV